MFSPNFKFHKEIEELVKLNLYSISDSVYSLSLHEEEASQTLYSKIYRVLFVYI